MFHFFATKVLGLAREESGHRFGSFSMESLPDDLWRIVFAFAGPAAGARQVAARARTLDEFVEYRLTSETDHSYERTTIADGFLKTRAHIKLVHALRTVSKQWRDIITYGSARQLTLKADSCVDLPPDFATRFGGCEAFSASICIATRMGTISSGPRRCTGGTRDAVMIGGTSCSSRRLPRITSSSRAARAARARF